jgi:hypothetical protein
MPDAICTKLSCDLRMPGRELRHVGHHPLLLGVHFSRWLRQNRLIPVCDWHADDRMMCILAVSAVLMILWHNNH